MLALLPGFAGAALPWRARLAVAASLSAFTAFGPQAPVLTLAMLPGEVLAGLLAGLAVALAFAAAQLAGEVAAQMIGLGFAVDAGRGGQCLGDRRAVDAADVAAPSCRSMGICNCSAPSWRGRG